MWLYLILFRGNFWRCDQRLENQELPVPDFWPEVVAVVPARNEEAVIGQSLAGLIAQDYPGRFQVVLVDDHSEDATRNRAEQAAAQAPEGLRLAVVAADPLPLEWSGKLWAVSEGIRQAMAQAPDCRYLLLTDADIGHDSGSLRRLVAKAEAERLDMVSLMVLLDHSGFWAGLLIPAFVFFFQKLYPFSWVNDHDHPMAAAAGGCILVRREALEAVGGIARIRGALIDDCTLAAVIKSRDAHGGGGRLWLGLTTRLISLRPYVRFGEIWDMVARTAYTQLDHSPWLLLGTLAGMALIYLAAPGVALVQPIGSVAGTLALSAWLLMMVAYYPTLRLYNKPWAHAVLLPAVGLLYSMMTVASAVRYWRGQGGRWKGRVHQRANDTSPATEAGR